MSLTERFIRYARIDTTSDPKSGTTPSTMKQFDLAKVLLEELKELGLKDAEMTDKCSVYAHLESNLDHKVPTVGFIAHMDTAPDFNGTGVNPRIIENYDGNDIELCEGVVTKVEEFPLLKKYVGNTLIVTDGSTLLGADDKAGIAEIMGAVKYLIDHPEIPHGRIAIAFTPDEEIGEGTKYFDIEKFAADFAYTVDGGEVRKYADNTFNAAAAVVTFKGFSIHPGSAKDHMINACNLAMEFHGMLPQWMRPEHTEKYEGFIHLGHMTGDTDHAELEYILRDHDSEKLEVQKEMLKSCASYIRQVYGEDTCVVNIRDQYQNMHNILKDYPEIGELALSSIKELGMEPDFEIVRGGTDGAMLTYKGLPCPNLGTGGANAHGRYEYAVIEEMQKGADLILTIAKKVGQK